MEALHSLLTSDEPALRFKARVGLLGEDPQSPEMQVLRQEIATSPRVQALLAERTAEGTIPRHPYQKWMGAHWVLTQLADLGHPPGDAALKPLVDQGLAWALRLQPTWIEGRARRCCSQEGNALLYALRLGWADARCEELAKRLMSYQWEDGGWNCDRKPSASHASFHESLIPLRALYAYAEVGGDNAAAYAAENAGEMFLARQLFRRLTTGEVIHPAFIQLHYPYTWHYTFLYGLRVMQECGRLQDWRCAEALDLLESKRLPEGGWPAERCYYATVELGTTVRRATQTPVEWGPPPSRPPRANPWITAEALLVLRAAGRV